MPTTLFSPNLKHLKGHCNTERNRTLVFLLETLPKIRTVLLLPWQDSPRPKFRLECELKPPIFWNRKALIYWAIENCISLFIGFPNKGGGKKIKYFCSCSRGFRYGPHVWKCNAFTYRDSVSKLPSIMISFSLALFLSINHFCCPNFACLPHADRRTGYYYCFPPNKYCCL